jgi:hypothetical protein
MLSLWVLVALVLSGCSPIPPPHPGSVPDRILFIGTSYTYWNEGVDKHLQGMAESASPRLRIEADSATMGGTPLSGLWQSKFVQNKIQKGNWDVVVVQGSLSMGEDAESYEEYVRKFDELIRGVGARSVLFMNWQLNYDPDSPSYEHLPPIEEIAQVVSRTGAEVNAEAAPVGLAWERALAEDPDLELFAEDRDHPNAHGTYLTTAVFYATIFDRSPEGLPYGLEEIVPEHEAYDEDRVKYTVPEEEKAFLQRIAWETVQEYQAQQGASQ